MDVRHLLSPRRLQQLWYAPILALAMGLMLVRNLVMARLLDLPNFAQFSAGLLVSSTFCMLACLGLQPLLQRELPVQLVRRRERAGQVLLAQCLLVAAACAVAGLLLFAGGLSAAGLSPAQAAVATGHGFAQQVFLIATVESRSRGEPLRFAQQNLWRAAAVLGIGAAIGQWSGSASAVLASEALLTLAMCHAMLRAMLQRTGQKAMLIGRLALRRLGRLPWTSAATLLAVTIVGFLLINADRWVAAEWLARPDFAHYAFAWTLLMIAQSTQGVINASVYPLLSRRFASAGRRTTFGLCARLSLVLFALGVVLVWPADWLLSRAILLWFPGYADANALLPIFLFIAVLRLSDFWSSFLVIVGLERRLLGVNLLTAALAGGCWLLWLQGQASPSPGLGDIALLAAGLTALGYLATALLSWSATLP